jgi:hypothetical protein
MKHLFLISFFILVTSNAAGQALVIKSIVGGQVRGNVESIKQQELRAESIKQQELKDDVVKLYINGLPFAKQPHDYTMIPPFDYNETVSNLQRFHGEDLDMSFEKYIDRNKNYLEF